MEPFANLLRPINLKDVIGQSHLKVFLNALIEKQNHISLLLYGKPGIGKTSLAYVICNELKTNYSYFNAAIGNKKELESLIAQYDYLIIDEIHRLNKDKQDILLPALEYNKVKIIATTTENPYFVVNPAVRSRMHILELKDLSVPELIEGMENAILKLKSKIKISSKFLEAIALSSNGDYRYCLNILDLIAKLYEDQEITDDILKTLIPSIHFYSDRDGDSHYDLLSAFHKSLRGSDVDASLYYLARLINSGDILGLERRLIAATYEDVGLANPNLALRVISAIDAAKKLGFPEARLPLANAVIQVATSPKSNEAYLAITKAIELAEKSHPIPQHLRDSHYQSASKLGRGVGYKYSHNDKSKQQFLPDELVGTKIFEKNIL